MAFVASAGLLVIRSRRVRVEISGDRVQVVNLFLSHRLTPPVKILALKGSNAKVIEMELRARRLLA